MAQSGEATTESPATPPDNLSLNPPITAKATAAPPGIKRRISPPRTLPKSQSEQSQITWPKLIGGFSVIAAIIGIIYSYGVLNQKVESNSERIIDNQSEQKVTITKLDDIAHRITRLESQFEAANKNGTSPIRFAKDLEELKEELGKQGRNASVLSDRLLDLEGRLSVTTTGPSP